MSRLFIIALFAFLWITPETILAQTLADKVQEYKLDNGATVLLVERHASPTVAAYISFRVGGVNETSQERGVAHLLEHMLFKGTKTLGTKNYAVEKKLLQQIKTIGKEIDALKFRADTDPQRLQQLQESLAQVQAEHRKLVVKNEFSRIYGENGGVGYNAYTSKDATTYLINLPANKLELWAAIESDRLQNAVFREFYTERDVVHEERRRSYESSPDGMMYETLLATAYKVHPYRNPIIGWNSDIDSLDPDQIREFFDKYYTPVNMVITLVGDFESEATLEMVKRYFGKLKPGVPVPPVVDREPEQNGERRVTINFDAEPQLMIAYHKPTMPHRDDYAFDLLMQVLSEGRTSRFYQSLVVDKQLVTDVNVFGAPGSRYDNLMVVSLTPRNGRSSAEVEAAVYAELERFRSELLSPGELEVARNQILTSILRSLKGNSGLARMLSSYQTLGDWHYLVEYEDQLNSITPEDIMAVAKRYLQADNRTVVTLMREEQN
ncbi:Predicted Zn-dependent peptidase [Desulfuromusa kysingii]|uniref:Predicted Zn-dependent peptidase n=1 Tax=Desulfuromusa kysingii TaxID=37625 RepID=A0A1H3YTE1_9BACT|nr:pitrilysin family protein [Desulfuromusa kysingii]SEA14284.1 Predicted Zn-dependent peptidase [Desulfuromusa kysingii]